MNSPLTRHQRRALARHAAGVEAATAADRRFFERHHDRSHRVRLASRDEIATREIITGLSAADVEPDTRIFVLIQQIAPGVRMRAYAPGPASEAGEDASEAVASELWRSWSARNPAIAKREAMLRQAASQPGGPLHAGGA